MCRWNGDESMTLDMFYFLLKSGRLYWTYLLQQFELPKSSTKQMPFFLPINLKRVPTGDTAVFVRAAQI